MSQKENIRIWRINGQEFELDLDDADVLENVMNAFETIDKEQDELKKDGPTVEYVRKYCKIYYHMFDIIFGQGTGDKIFSGKHNARVCEEISDSFIEFAGKQVKKINERRFANNHKYYPAQKQKNKKYYGNRR